MTSKCASLLAIAGSAFALLVAAPVGAGPGWRGIVVYNAQHESLTQAWADGFTKRDRHQGDAAQRQRHRARQPDRRRKAPPRRPTCSSPRIRRPWCWSTMPACSRRSPPTRWPRCPANFRPANGHWIGIAARSTVFAYDKTQADARTSCRSRCSTSPIPPGRAAGPPRPRAPISRRSSARCWQLKGEAATAAWLKAMKENATRLPRQQRRDEGRQCRRGRGRGDLPLLLLRRSGQDRREQRATSALHYFQNQDPGAFVSISGGGVLASSKHQERGAGLPEMDRRQGRPGRS